MRFSHGYVIEKITMAITEIFDGLFKTKNPKEKTKGEKTLSQSEFRYLVEQLSGNTKVLFRCTHTDGTIVEPHCVVDNVKGNYLALCNKKDHKFYFIELSRIIRFDLTRDFGALKAEFYYEVKR
jgi:hypothetical protein